MKDKITRSDRPNDLKEMIKRVVKINNHNYEQQLEKQGQYANPGFKKNTRGKKKSYWP